MKLHISKVFDASGSASWSTVIAGFESCVANRANVVNMSLGGAYSSSLAPFQDAINDAYNINNILIFASSGTARLSNYNYPASFDNVISVASIDSLYSRSYFSTYNNEVDIFAPGSSVAGGGYGYKSGTSMACPHAAGVAALVWSTYPSLSHKVLKNILKNTTQDLPQNSNDGYDIYYGHGLINAKAAYDAVQLSIIPTVSPPQSLTVSPSLFPTVSPAPSVVRTASPSIFPTVSPATTSRQSEVCPDGGGIKAVVEVNTDKYPAETSWDFKDASGTVVASGGDYTRAFTSHHDSVCLEETASCDGINYSFTIYDSVGDGICCSYGNGNYTVYIDDEMKASGGEFGSFETTSFCGEPTATPTMLPTDAPTDALTVLRTDWPTVLTTDAPTDAPNDAPTVLPTNVPTDSPTDPSTDSPTDVPTMHLINAPTSAAIVLSSRALTMFPAN